MSGDLFSLSDIETALPSVEPISPDEFGEEFGSDVDNLNVDDFPTLLEGIFDPYRDASNPFLASSVQYREFTNSTALIEATADSEYASTAYSTSSTLFTFHPGLEYNSKDVDPGKNFVSSAPFDTFETLQFSQALFQPVDVVNAQFDDGRDQPAAAISPGSLSAALQIPPPAVPTGPFVDAAPATQRCTGPIRTKHICPICGESPKRSSNLNAHMKTHDPDRLKFWCPENGCGRSFTRTNCRKRHLVKVHGYPATQK